MKRKRIKSKLLLGSTSFLRKVKIKRVVPLPDINFKPIYINDSRRG